MAKKKSLKAVAKIMSDLDLCMFTTVTARGIAASRPMSNNGDVEYDGKSYFFTWAKSRTAKDVAKDPHVNLSFVGSKRFKKIYVSVSGKAKLIKDREVMREHWNKDLEIWFKDGIETRGLVMIEVDATHIKYWHGMEEGELALR